MTPYETSKRTARVLMIDLGHTLDQIFASGLIPEEHQQRLREELRSEENIELIPVRAISANANRGEWLNSCDPLSWHYWPALRQYLLSRKGWDISVVRSLDSSSDNILRQLANPTEERFDVRGLVLGFVQSGKTSSYTSLIAKAADVGYRLVIVLSGIDNGLRRQTNIRLKKELVGYADGSKNAVDLPPIGKRWHEFTSDRFDGDFLPGNATHGALQGSQPVLIVTKKNGPVLRRLLAWLDDAPSEVTKTLPVLVIDDEADQASIDTKGTYQTAESQDGGPYDPPSVINGLIRRLLSSFDKCAYVAYTATPFANVLIPHDTADRDVGNDLYPKDFIVDLPKPQGYFGAEEIFGRMDGALGEEIGGLDIIREVSDQDVFDINNDILPNSLESALLDFVLAGAARCQRGDKDKPATMLIHTSRLVDDQNRLRTLVQDTLSGFRDEWMYQRKHGLKDRLQERWENDFRPLTRSVSMDRDIDFNAMENHITYFFQAVSENIREINSASGDVLDYEREPALKAIAVGGNSLSRGLTLEGLLVSYFARTTSMYDTLMQMGRWFGFRQGYEDLTRIYTTPTLEEWFSDLAHVEYRIREDIRVYENLGARPFDIGMRIWQHPVMQVTSPLKSRNASWHVDDPSYSLSLEQTFKFPLQDITTLKQQEENNLSVTVEFLDRLGPSDSNHPDAGSSGPVWTNVPVQDVVSYLQSFQVDDTLRSMSMKHITSYVESAAANGELTSWTIAIRGRQTKNADLGIANWGVNAPALNQISRSRLGTTNSLGVITSPNDERVGLSKEQKKLADEATQGVRGLSKGRAAREQRDPSNGLVLLYPISKNSGRAKDPNTKGSRRQLFDDDDTSNFPNLIGMALSFPRSHHKSQTTVFVEGTVPFSNEDEQE